jgi:hypothetical protein
MTGVKESRQFRIPDSVKIIRLDGPVFTASRIHCYTAQEKGVKGLDYWEVGLTGIKIGTRIVHLAWQ